MIAFGTIPDWITAGTALISLKFLIQYAESADVQARASTKQLRESLRPILLVTELNQGSTDSEREFRVENQGAGVALDIRFQAGGEPNESNRIFGPTLALGPKCGFQAKFTAPLDTKLFFVYFSIFGEEFRTEITVTETLYTNWYYPVPGSRRFYPSQEERL